MSVYDTHSVEGMDSFFVFTSWTDEDVHVYSVEYSDCIQYLLR